MKERPLRRSIIAIVGVLLVAVLGLFGYQAYEAARRAAYQASLAPHVTKATQYVDDVIKEGALKGALTSTAGIAEIEARGQELNALIEEIRRNAPAKYADITHPVVNYLEAGRAAILRMSGMTSRLMRLMKQFEDVQSFDQSVQKKTLTRRAEKEALDFMVTKFGDTIQGVTRDLEGMNQGLDALQAAEEQVKPLYPSVTYVDDVKIASSKDEIAKAIGEFGELLSQLRMMTAMLPFM